MTSLDKEPPASVSIGEAARLIGVRVGLVRKWLDAYLAEPEGADHKIKGFALPDSGHRRVYEASISECRQMLHGGA